LKDPDFQKFLAAQDIRFIGFRPLRDLLRKQK
jgi:hypothetical protein